MKVRTTALAVVLLVSACSGPVGSPPSPDATVDGCAGLVTSSAAPSGSPLAGIALRCAQGGATVELGGLRGPAVVNLWASWCSPCRDELPALERFAQRYAGEIAVIGVNTTDTNAGRQAIMEDFGLTFPVLRDDGALVRTAVRKTSLPVTLFVDGEGQVAYVYHDTALTEDTLTRLAEEHLGLEAG